MAGHRFPRTIAGGETLVLYINICDTNTFNYKLNIMARDRDNREIQIPSTMRVVFGIIMIIVYVGMGILLLINFFGWQGELLTWLRWCGGVLFIIYGIWRAIRQFWGIDSSL